MIAFTVVLSQFEYSNIFKIIFNGIIDILGDIGRYVIIDNSSMLPLIRRPKFTQILFRIAEFVEALVHFFVLLYSAIQTSNFRL